MLETMTSIYCICDDILQTVNFSDDLQCKMSSAEIATFALMSAMHYGCDYTKTRLVSKKFKLFPKVLSLSQLVRRIHQIPEYIWMMIFQSLKVLTMNEKSEIFIVDSFPVKAYENHKSFRARIFKDKEYHGYCASKKVYFFGIKVHMIVDSNGIPVEFSFTPGSHSDVKALEDFDFSSLGGAFLLGDKAYTNYAVEDLLKETENVNLLPKRKQNLKRQNRQEENFLLSIYRNRIETVFSSITRKFPRYITARTEKGFCLKVMFCILAYMTTRLSKST